MKLDDIVLEEVIRLLSPTSYQYENWLHSVNTTLHTSSWPFSKIPRNVIEAWPLPSALKQQIKKRMKGNLHFFFENHLKIRFFDHFQKLCNFQIRLRFSLSYENVSESAEYLLKRTSHRPKIAVICGSGLGTRFFLHFLWSKWHPFWFRFWFEPFSWTSGFTGKFRLFSLWRYSRFPCFHCTRSPISLTFWAIEGYSGHVNARTISFVWRVSTRTSEYTIVAKNNGYKMQLKSSFSTQHNMFLCGR